MAQKTRKRRKTAGPPPLDTPGSAESLSILPANDASTTPSRKPSNQACALCKRRKTRCEFVPEENACRSCIAKDLADDCAPPRASKTRSISRGQPNPPPEHENLLTDDHSSQKRSQHNDSSSKTRGRSLTRSNSNSARPRKQSHSVSRTHGQDKFQTALPAVPEIDEDDLLILDKQVTSFALAMGHRNASKKKRSFETLSNDSDESDNLSESSDGLDELDSDAISEQMAARMKMRKVPHSNPRPPMYTAPSRQQKGKGAARSTSTQRTGIDVRDGTHNPETCSFSIPSAVKSTDGSNMSFIVPSDVTFDSLRIMVAEKLRCFPGLLRLRYRLESDKPKTGATSIQSEDELRFFKDRMRGLLVPQRLPSGKISSRALKPVLVYFEDASDEKEVLTVNKSAASSKKGSSTVSTNESDPQSNKFNQLHNERQKVIGELQARWRCDLHSKEKDVYCWSPKPGSICYALNHSNLGFWAVDIMAGNSSIDTKPNTLHLNDARPRGRASSSQPIIENPGFPFPGGYNYANPFMMPPMHIPMPPFYNPGIGQNPGSHPFPYLSHSHAVPETSAHTANSRPTTIKYPEVTRWFQFLDEHEERSKDRIHFAPYGQVLKEKGFLRITQLTLDFVTLKDLQEWLDIEVGTAILIMQYAKDDVESIKAGNLIIPE